MLSFSILVWYTKIALLFIKKVIFLIIYYLNFTIILLKVLVMKLVKCPGVKKYAINSKLDKKLFYILIYSFKLIKLKTF